MGFLKINPFTHKLRIMFRKLTDKEVESIRRFLKLYLKIVSVVLVIFLVSATVLLFYLSDRANCLRENSESTCIRDFLAYWTDAIRGNCFINKADTATNTSYPVSRILMDLYLVNTNFSQSDTQALIKTLDATWMRYSVNISPREVNYINNKSLDLGLECPKLKQLSETIVKHLSDDNVTDVIIAPFSSLGNEGVGWISFPCVKQSPRISLVAVSTESQNLTWNLAHEFGHILGLTDKAYYSGELNLMTHSDCVRNRYWSTILNQAQVDVVTSTARQMEISQKDFFNESAIKYPPQEEQS